MWEGAFGMGFPGAGPLGASAHGSSPSLGPQETVTSNVLVFDGRKKLATHTHDFNNSDFLIHLLGKVVNSEYNDGPSSLATSLV